jgi:hypothetical protein
MKIDLRAAVARLAAVVIGGALVLAVGVAPATAQPVTGQDKHMTKSLRGTVDVSGLQRQLDQAKVARVAGGDATPLATPHCLAGSTDYEGTYYPDSPPVWSYEYEWTWDSTTGLTYEADVVWNSEIQCNNMNYMSISSNLFFLNSQVATGTHESCGSTSDDLDHGCGFRQTDGTWACAGLGDCDGNYFVTIGWTWILPAGWQWVSLPGSCTEISSRNALCLWTTPAFFIPYIN